MRYGVPKRFNSIFTLEQYWINAGKVLVFSQYGNS